MQIQLPEKVFSIVTEMKLELFIFFYTIVISVVMLISFSGCPAASFPL